jgi:hypothetical protein
MCESGSLEADHIMHYRPMGKIVFEHGSDHSASFKNATLLGTTTT